VAPLIANNMLIGFGGILLAGYSQENKTTMPRRLRLIKNSPEC